MKKQRKHYTPEEKVAILRRHLLEKEPISKLCDELGLQPTVFYRWQKEFFENGAASFEQKRPTNHSAEACARRRTRNAAGWGRPESPPCRSPTVRRWLRPRRPRCLADHRVRRFCRASGSKARERLTAARNRGARGFPPLGRTNARGPNASNEMPVMSPLSSIARPTLATSLETSSCTVPRSWMRVSGLQKKA
jgi:transposase-like protein